MKNSKRIFSQGKAFPASFRGISYMLVLISFAFIVHQKSDVLKNPLVWIIYLFFLVVHIGKSYIDVISVEKGIFRQVTKIAMFKFGKVKRIGDYKHGIVKVVRQVYFLPRGAEPWKDRDKPVTSYIAKLWLIRKKDDMQELIFRGRKEELDLFISEFIRKQNITLYKGFYQKGREYYIT